MKQKPILTAILVLFSCLDAAASWANSSATIGPQSPRDLDHHQGANHQTFPVAPPFTDMNLCNIHFHESAEHKGGDFTQPAEAPTKQDHAQGNGHGAGFLYTGALSSAERQPVPEGVCRSEHGSLQAGDTIEVHYVFSTAKVKPGPMLGACLLPAGPKPLLRVEAQVLVLVNDPTAADFKQLAKTDEARDRHQAPNLPAASGTPVEYAGSTTGPAYNSHPSPFEVTWSVRPKTMKVDVSSVGKWCEGNLFQESHAHGVRHLVMDEKLLSPIT